MNFCKFLQIYQFRFRRLWLLSNQQRQNEFTNRTKIWIVALRDNTVMPHSILTDATTAASLSIEVTEVALAIVRYPETRLILLLD